MFSARDVSCVKNSLSTQRKRAKGGRKTKLSLDDLLMVTIQYMREYRTYEQITADFGIHERNLLHRGQWVEVTLVQNGFTISNSALIMKNSKIRRIVR
ncbi:IS1381 transposase protein A [Streptococcus pneumoniae]|nr:IS1381 transposase protein A [Streptococcus pneumoniae]